MKLNPFIDSPAESYRMAKYWLIFCVINFNFRPFARAGCGGGCCKVEMTTKYGNTIQNGLNNAQWISLPVIPFMRVLILARGSRISDCFKLSSSVFVQAREMSGQFQGWGNQGKTKTENRELQTNKLQDYYLLNLVMFRTYIYTCGPN